jgi:predicted  nucleic acid-binding Zn-ribbon protein
LKTQLQQALQGSKLFSRRLYSTEFVAIKGAGNKNTSTTNGNVKQLEYELTEARYRIEKLEKQIAANTVKDDRTALESQVNFLNDVIVELRNTNERLQKEIEFQKNPFVGDDESSGNTTTRVKSSAPRLYCKLKD